MSSIGNNVRTRLIHQFDHVYVVPPYSSASKRHMIDGMKFARPTGSRLRSSSTMKFYPVEASFSITFFGKRDTARV